MRHLWRAVVRLLAAGGFSHVACTEGPHAAKCVVTKVQGYVGETAAAAAMQTDEQSVAALQETAWSMQYVARWGPSPASTAQPAVAPAPRFAATSRQFGTLLLLLLGFVSAADATMKSGMARVEPAGGIM